MDDKKFDPHYTEELSKQLDKQNQRLTQAHRLMLNELQKLQCFVLYVEEEMLVRKLYEVMSAHGLTKESGNHSCASYNSGAQHSNANVNDANEEQ